MSKKGYIMTDNNGFENGKFASLDEVVFSDGTKAVDVKENLEKLSLKVKEQGAVIEKQQETIDKLLKIVDYLNTNVELLKVEVLN